VRNKGAALALVVLILLVPIGSLFSYLAPHENHSSYHKETKGTSTDTAVDWLTFGLVIVGLAQAALFWWQLNLIREGSADTKEAARAAGESAKAARDTVELARKTAERELRAYVMVDTVAFFQPDGPDGRTYIHVELKNFGQTPCYRGELIAGADVCLTKPLDFVIPLDEKSERYPEVTMAPGHLHIIHIERSEEVTGKWHSLNDSGKTAYVWGRLIYQDAFDNKHVTEFQLFNPFFNALNFAFCKVGNTAT
jgi:hypothetical protein